MLKFGRSLSWRSGGRGRYWRLYEENNTRFEHDVQRSKASLEFEMRFRHRCCNGTMMDTRTTSAHEQGQQHAFGESILGGIICNTSKRQQDIPLPHPRPILRRRHHLRSYAILVVPLPPTRPQPTATIPIRPYRTAMRCLITRYRRQTIHREVWRNSRRIRIRRPTCLPFDLDGVIL